MEKRSQIIIFFAILIVAIVFRFAFFNSLPPSLNWDEVSHGYNAYSLLKTGMDQWGQSWPVFNFRAYGDFPTTLNLYLTIPFVALFGLSQFSIRFPHAILGVLTVISIYFFAWGVARDKKISLLAAFLAATGPWYVFTSRFVLQSNLSVFILSVCGALFFNRDKNKYFLPLSLFGLFLSLFAYHTTRIFSPLLLVSVIFLYAKDLRGLFPARKLGGVSLVLFISLFFVLTGYILQNPDARARGGVLFLVDQGAINRINSARSESKLPIILNKIVNNKITFFAKGFATNYVTYFSPSFLFLKGGTQYQFSIPNMGLIYPVMMPFFYLGILVLVSKAIKDKNYLLVAIWLILSPIPASVTNEQYAVLRATTMLPVTEIVISLGFFWLIGRLKNIYVWVFLIVCCLLFYVQTEKYILTYIGNYRVNYSWAWQYGYKEATDYAMTKYTNYDKIVVTKKYGEPHEFFLFFSKWDPSLYQQDPSSIKFYQSGWYWVDRFDKFYFLNDWQIVDQTGRNKVFIQESKKVVDCTVPKCLLITSPGNAPKGWRKMKIINFLDNSEAFEIYDNQQ